MRAARKTLSKNNGVSSEKFSKMPKSERKISLFDDCVFGAFPPEKWNGAFVSGDSEGVDFYFAQEAKNFEEQKLARNYCFTLKSNPGKIVCAFALSNDGIRKEILSNSARRKISKGIPFEKTRKIDTFPAVLIGQFGISEDFHDMGIGSQTLDFIKIWLTEKTYPTGFRFIIVDARKDALKFYEKNGFALVYKKESEEKEAFGFSDDETISTRFMMFNIKDASAKQK